MTLLVCNQTQIETVKTASVESIIQTRERADSYSVMIDDDDASRSIDRSFDNSNNSSTMMIDPISLQSQADNLLMKLNQASSNTSSTFTSSVSDETTTNGYNENNNGHQNYEDHNRTNGTTITTASKRMACVDNTNNTNPIIPSSFDSSTTCTSSIMHRDREHDLDNASSDSNSNSNSNNPLFDMYVQLKMKRQQMEEEEEEELQQQVCARQQQGPTGLVGPLVLSEGGGTTTGRDHNNQDCIIDATTKASSLLDADSSMSTSAISHMVMKSNDNFNEMMHTSLPTNFNWMNTNYNNTSSFCNFNPITDDGNDDIGNSFTGDLTTTCGTTDTTYNNNYSNSFAFNGNSTSNNGTSTSTSISNGNCNNDNNNFIANSHININNNNENNNFQQQQPAQIQLQDFSNLTTEQLREMIMIGTTEMTNLTTTNKRENSSDRGTCSSSSLDGSGIINSGIDNGSIGGNNNQLFAGSSISGRSNSTPVLHTRTSITASNNPFLQNLSVMDYRNKNIKISTTPSTGDGGGIGIGICGSSSSTANATFLSSTTYNNNSEQNQEEKDDDADPICCPQEQEQMMMMEQEESSSSAMVVADESATEISGMILAPWSEHASKLFSDLMEESREEERLKKVALRMKPKDKPKRPLSAYNLFFKEERNRILESENKNDDPATNLDSSSYSDSTGFESLAKVIGSRWQKLVAGNDDDDDEASRSKMAVYKTKASIDMERYKGEMNIWNLKNGRTTTNKNDKSKSRTTRRYSGGPRIRKTSNKGIRKIRNTNNKKNNSNVDMDLSSKPDVDRPLSSGHDDDYRHHQQQQQQHQERRKSTGEDFINNVVATRTPFKWGTLDPGLFQLTNTEAHNNDNNENEIELTLQEV